jgi:DNA-binding XRE family transcriptional regulator
VPPSPRGGAGPARRAGLAGSPGHPGLRDLACNHRGAQMPMNAPNPIDKHVGSRLRMRRLMLDMSQTDIADALGLTFQQVQKYEKGSNRISASRLQHLSQILQVPVPFFFEARRPRRVCGKRLRVRLMLPLPPT